MPTYKHPCPHCDRLIDRIVAACPYCGTPEPFAPRRCVKCRAILAAGWVACPSCGTPVGQPASTGGAAAGPPTTTKPTAEPRAAATSPAAPGGPMPSHAPASASGAVRCSGCGAPLPSGARFCTVCGTLAG